MDRIQTMELEFKLRIAVKNFTSLFFLMIFLLSKSLAFATPAITDIQPSVGPSGGGTVITISGTEFTGATAVTFAVNTPAASFIVNSDTSITAVTPANLSGVQLAVPVRVTAPGGTSSPTVTAVNNFAYEGPWFIFVLDATTNTITPIDLSTNTAAPSQATGGTGTFEMTLTPDGSKAYVSCAGIPNDFVAGFDLTATPPALISNTSLGSGVAPR